MASSLRAYTRGIRGDRRSLKHEDIYLKGYADGREVKAGIAAWMAFYNDRRLHQALGYRTPMAVYREGCGHDGQRCALPTGPQQKQTTTPLAA